MGFRFQKRISLLPCVRINLSKSGVSTSLGPRGADVNIGRGGVTANGGIPGTGLSYRQKLGGGGKGGLLGILAVVGGLGVWGFQHASKIEKFFAPVPVRQAASATPAPVSAPTAAAAGAIQAVTPGLRYVHRSNSILREEAKTSSHVLKKEMKGAQVMLLSEGDGWSQVRDDNITGFMRSSVLGTDPPR